jgi:hypothetical protein
VATAAEKRGRKLGNEPVLVKKTFPLAPAAFCRPCVGESLSPYLEAFPLSVRRFDLAFVTEFPKDAACVVGSLMCVLAVSGFLGN